MTNICIVDFGSQYSHLIKRRLEEVGVQSVIKEIQEVENLNTYDGFILSGGQALLQKMRLV